MTRQGFLRSMLVGVGAAVVMPVRALGTLGKPAAMDEVATVRTCVVGGWSIPKVTTYSQWAYLTEVRVSQSRVSDNVSGVITRNGVVPQTLRNDRAVSVRQEGR